jgi:chemotaxis signal transduction protein
VLFCVADEVFALPFTVVREVVRPGLPHRVPRAPFGCLGALDLRGQRMPVLCVGVLLGFYPPPRGELLNARLLDSHLLIIDLEGRPYALLVDRVLDVLAAPQHLPAEAESVSRLGRASQLVRGAVRFSGGTAWLLHPDGLLGRGRVKLLERATARAVE